MAMAAQALAVSAANAQESLTCVKCLVQLAVHQIVGLRGLFPDDAFKRRDIAGLTNVAELKADYSAETRLVCDWVDRGVNDALTKRLLKTMVFSISTDGISPEVVEQFVFEFGFTPNGAAMAVSTKGRGAKAAVAASVEASTLGGLRKQACNLLRSLIATMSTLSPVPEERVLSIQLVYTDDVEQSYEPPGFVAATPEALGAFAHKPTELPIGNLRSDHHRVGVRVHSILDAEDGGAAQAVCRDTVCLRSVAGGISQGGAQTQTSDARVLSAMPRAADGADEGYGSDETRDEAPHAPAVVFRRHPLAEPSSEVVQKLPPPAAVATRRSVRTQKADAHDITAKLANLKTAEPAAGGKKKRGVETEAQQPESQGAKRPRKMSAPAQPIRQTAAVDLFSAR